MASDVRSARGRARTTALGSGDRVKVLYDVCRSGRREAKPEAKRGSDRGDARR